MSLPATATQLHDAMLAEINKDHSGSVEDEEFEYWYNQAQVQFIQDRADHDQTHQRISDDLRTLRREETIAPTDAAAGTFNLETILNAGGADAIVDFTPAVQGQYGYLRMENLFVEWNFISNPCHVTDGVVTDEWYVVKPMSSDKKGDIEKDSYNKPKDERPYWEMYGDGTSSHWLRIINNTDSEPNRARMEYLVHPRDVLIANNAITDNDFPIAARIKVAKLAARMYLESIESRRYQTYVAEQQSHIQ